MSAHCEAFDRYYTPVVARRRVSGVGLSLLAQRTERALPPHGHAEAYLTLLISGSYSERCGRRELRHQVASVVFHPAGLEHTDAYGSSGGTILAAVIGDEWLASFGRRDLERRDPSEVVGPGVLRAALGLYQAVARPSHSDPLEVDEHLTELLSAVRSLRVVKERARPGWLDSVVDRLGAEYADPPRLGDLARQSGVHPSHLSRTFRRYVGCSPTEFVQRRRVEHVWSRLARREPRSLADLALEAGFSDQSHCTRVFKRSVGLPPGAFGDLMRGGVVAANAAG